jgi:hypothetical protein
VIIGLAIRSLVYFLQDQPLFLLRWIFRGASLLPILIRPGRLFRRMFKESAQGEKIAPFDPSRKKKEQGHHGHAQADA